MKITPKKDRRFNGGGFTGMLIKGVPIEVPDALGQHLVNADIADETKAEKLNQANIEEDTNVETD